MKHVPPRLHIIFASEQNYAVILRRGPSKFVSTFGWNLTTHQIALGQWFKGRINGHKCSLSPNGQYFLYSAMDCKWDSATQGIWAAISRAPYLKALELYADIESRGGGGLFVSNTDYQLNEIFFAKEKFLRKSDLFNCLNTPDEHCMYGGNGVYIERLRISGWQFEGRVEYEKFHSATIFAKAINKSVVVKKRLMAKYSAKIMEWEEHEIYILGELKYSTNTWECAEVRGNTIFYTKQGLLKSLAITADLVLGSENIIHDFNGYQFKPVVAPYDY